MASGTGKVGPALVSGDRLELLGIALCTLGGAALIFAASTFGPFAAAAVAGVLLLVAGALVVRAAASLPEKGGES